MRFFFNALIVLPPFGSGASCGNRSSDRGSRGLILLVTFLVMAFVGGFNHGYH
jgi:hypothetical protein